MQLLDLQRRFITSLVLSKIDPILRNNIQTLKPPSSTERLQCYRNNFKLGLTKTLRKIYPICCALVGDKFFQGMALEYVQRHPPTSYNLNHFGGTFANFIAQFKQAESLNYLSEVASLEWVIHQVMIGVDAPCFNFEAFSAIKEQEVDNVIFHLRENAVLLYSSYPIDRIWEIHQEDFLGDFQVDLMTEEVWLFIFRINFSLRMVRLTPIEWQLLTAIQKGISFKGLQTKMLEKLGENAEQQGKKLMTSWISHGFITGFSVKNKPIGL